LPKRGLILTGNVDLVECLWNSPLLATDFKVVEEMSLGMLCDRKLSGCESEFFQTTAVVKSILILAIVSCTTKLCDPLV
jgi:hypothetical protein